MNNKKDNELYIDLDGELSLEIFSELSKVEWDLNKKLFNKLYDKIHVELDNDLYNDLFNI
jgi:hypothetical protein